MPPNEVLRIFRGSITQEDFEDFIQAHDEEIKRPVLLDETPL
jgi:hypothetical protein